MKSEIYGCKVNKYYLDKWIGYFQNDKKNHDNDILIASCIVTDKAKNKWIKSTLKHIQNNTKIYLTGCGSLDGGGKIDEKKFYKLYPELEKFKSNIVLLGEDAEQIEAKKFKKFEKVEKTESGKFRNIETKYTRKFIVIQNGCDNYCSFCLTIQARGKHRSRSVENIVCEIKEFENQGGKEIVITGVNIGARGTATTTNSKESQLYFLLNEILDNTNIPRIRVSSLGPEYIDDKLLKVFENTRILPYFHLSVQSFSDKILQKMRRNYTSKDVYDIINKLRNLDRPGVELINIGADIICGFPGETDNEFDKTVSGIKKCNITQLHAFPFSPHHKAQTVPASHFDEKVYYHIAKERVKLLQYKGNINKQKLIQKTFGHSTNGLIEKVIDEIAYGRTANYLHFQIKGDYKTNTIIKFIYSSECQGK